MDQRIPIAIALTSFDRGGTERQMTEVIHRLDRSRFIVHALCFRREGPWLAAVEASAASVAEFRLGSLRSIETARQLARLSSWLRDRQIAVLHAADLYANILALTAACLARVPVRIGSRRGIVSPVPQRGLLALQRAAYTTAHRVVANSAAAAARLWREGVSRRRTAIIANGIDLRRFPIATREARRVVTVVANLRPGKGHDVLLRAVAALQPTHPDLVVQLVGDGPLRAALEQQVSELRIARQVRFLGHRDDVEVILGRSGMCALPSFMEASPNSVMEAMAAALPVVASRVGGIPELVTHGQTGLLVPPGDAQALASAIARLVDEPQLADALGRAARASIEARFSFDRMVGAFERLYVDAIQERRWRPLTRT